MDLLGFNFQLWHSININSTKRTLKTHLQIVQWLKTPGEEGARGGGGITMIHVDEEEPSGGKCSIVLGQSILPDQL